MLWEHSRPVLPLSTAEQTTTTGRQSQAKRGYELFQAPCPGLVLHSSFLLHSSLSPPRALRRALKLKSFTQLYLRYVLSEECLDTKNRLVTRVNKTQLSSSVWGLSIGTSMKVHSPAPACSLSDWFLKINQERIQVVSSQNDMKVTLLFPHILQASSLNRISEEQSEWDAHRAGNGRRYQVGRFPSLSCILSAPYFWQYKSSSVPGIWVRKLQPPDP